MLTTGINKEVYEEMINELIQNFKMACDMWEDGIIENELVIIRMNKLKSIIEKATGKTVLEVINES